MARQIQLEQLADFAVRKVHTSGLEVTDDDLVEVVAILTWRQHMQGNTEGQAKVKSKVWPAVTRSWQGKYRSLARDAEARYCGPNVFKM